jgi:transposase-like protein
MSRAAVSVKVSDIYKMEAKECMHYFVKIRFGSWKTVRCPGCGTVSSKHCYRNLQKRWRCKACDRSFSITAGSIFADRKISLQDLLAGALMWVNSAAGQPALELKRHSNTSYNTTFVIQHKLRESLMRAYNVGLLNGDLEMDGAHQSGWRADEKRGRPKGQRLTPLSEVTDQDVLDAMMGKNPQEPLAKNRRQLMTIRKRSGIDGYGAVSSRIGIGRSENKRVVQTLIRDFIAAPESDLNTDSAGPYSAVKRRFRAHRTVNHSEHLVGDNGENNVSGA